MCFRWSETEQQATRNMRMGCVHKQTHALAHKHTRTHKHMHKEKALIYAPPPSRMSCVHTSTMSMLLHRGEEPIMTPAIIILSEPRLPCCSHIMYQL